MKVIVGLGNPGPKYQFTRHNLGFMLIDRLAKKEPFQKKHSSLILKTKDTLLLKPQTFMNLSGQAVRKVISFYKLPLEDLIVVHDDKDLDFATLRFQKNRGHGGHNGIRNIHQSLGSQNYCRLKMGVLPKQKNQDSPHSSSLLLQLIKPLKRKKTSDLVLAPFTQEEQSQIPKILDRAELAIQYWIKEGHEKASNHFN